MPGLNSRKAEVTDDETRLRQAELLLQISRRVAAFETLDQVLTTLIEVISLELNAERCTIF